MTKPNDPKDVSATAETGPDNATASAAEVSDPGEDRVVLACSQSMSLLKAANKEFPDVTPEGTEMSREEANLARAAAKAARKQLHTLKGARS